MGNDLQPGYLADRLLTGLGQPYSTPAASSSGSAQRSRSTRSNHQGIGSGVTAGALCLTVLMVPKLSMVRACVKLLLHMRNCTLVAITESNHFSSKRVQKAKQGRSKKSKTEKTAAAAAAKTDQQVPEQEAVLGATAESPFVLRPFGSPQTTTSSTPQNYVPGIPISITYKPRHYGNLSIPTPE